MTLVFINANYFNTLYTQKPPTHKVRLAGQSVADPTPPYRAANLGS